MSIRSTKPNRDHVRLRHQSEQKQPAAPRQKSPVQKPQTPTPARAKQQQSHLNAHGNLHAKATLVDAEGELEADLLLAKAQAEGSAWVGAKTNLQGALAVDPLKGQFGLGVGANAFAGARAGVSGALQLRDLGGVSGGAEVWAGIGDSLNATASLKNGRLQGSFDYGAAIGIGGKSSIEVDLDVRPTTDAAAQLIKSPADTPRIVSQAVGNFFKRLF